MAKLMAFTKVVLKNLVSKPATYGYPYKKRELPERSRGHIEINIDDCVFCGLCSKRCPSTAITVDRTTKTWSIDRMGCVQCGNCVNACAKKCLTIVPGYTAPSSSKTVDSYSKPVTESASTGGYVANNIESCVLCGICAKKCPVNAITVDRANKIWSISRNECVTCGACVSSCPKKCLVMESGEAERSDYQKGATATAAPAVSTAPAADKKSKNAVEYLDSETVNTKIGSYVANNIEECLMCGLCEKKCPEKLIKIDRKAQSWTLDRDRCLGCGVCEDACPAGSLDLKGGNTNVFTYFKNGKMSGKQKPAERPKINVKCLNSETVDPKIGSYISNKFEDCLMCGLCEKKCPEELIKVDRDMQSWSLDRDHCLGCGVCEDACPVNCLDLKKGNTNVFTYFKGGMIAGKQKPCDDEEPESLITSKFGNYIANNLEGCLLCGYCAKKCPMGAIEIDRKSQSWNINRDLCIGCGVCEDSCPHGCLTLEAGNCKQDVYGLNNEADAANESHNDTEETNYISNTVSDCVMCGLCAKACPVSAITVDRASKTWTINRDECLVCGACIDNCPKHTLHLAHGHSDTSVYTKN